MRERTEKDKNDPDYLNPSSVPHYFSPITKLLEANDVTVNWNRVTQTYPERDNVDSSRGWTREEIRLMLDHAKEKKTPGDHTGAGKLRHAFRRIEAAVG